MDEIGKKIAAVAIFISIFIALVLIVYGIGIFAPIFFGYSTEASITINDTISSTENQELKDAYLPSMKITSAALGAIEFTTYLIFFASIIVFLICAYLVKDHPMFMGVWFFVILLLVGLTFILSNVYKDLSANNTMYTSWKANHYIMIYFPWFVGVFGFISLIVLFIVYKLSDTQSGGYY